MAGKGSEGGIPAPVLTDPSTGASAAVFPRSGGVQEMLAAQQRFNDYLRRMAGFTSSPYYAGSPLEGYGGPTLPPLPATAQYGPQGLLSPLVTPPTAPAPPGGTAPTLPSFNQPSNPAVPNMPLQTFLNMLRSPLAQMPRPPVQPPIPQQTMPPSLQPVQHTLGSPLPYNQPFMPAPFGMEAVHDYSIQRMNFDGRDVYRFEVRPGDVQPWDVGNIGPSGYANQRAEIRYTEGASAAKGNSPYNATPTTGHVIYNLGVNFDPDFALNQRWATLLQFHPADAGQPGGGMGGSFSGVGVHNGYIDITKPFQADGVAANEIARIPIQPNHWYDLKLDVNWANSSDGYVKVYDGDKLLGSYSGPTITAPYAYLKQGYYRDGGVTTTGVVYETPLNITIPR